ncbi:MAG: AMP-binding protein [Caldilinea sp.]|nr:AMP-binding protein [Caldilinea sp.]
MYIEVGGTRYSADEIRAGAWMAAPGLSANARAALDFTQAWLRGDASFAVRTSGSTGDPKPIHLTRQQMEASARATGAALGLASGQVALVALPAHYIAGRMMLVRGCVLDLEMLLVEPAGDPFADLAEGAHIDFAAFVPLQLQALLDVALVASSDSCFPEDTARAFRYRRLLDGMRAILVGGGPVGATLETQIAQLVAPVYHTYGMTETATHVALRRMNGPDATGRFAPLPGVAIGADARGCLHVTGPMTGGAMIQTNDLVEIHRDGSFAWLGRWDNVINSGGVKVQVEQVEAAAAQVAADQPELGLARRRFFVAGLPDERLGQEVVMLVEGPPLDDDQQSQLLWALGQELPRYHAPRRLLYLPAFADTTTGKIDRRQSMASLHQA